MAFLKIVLLLIALCIFSCCAHDYGRRGMRGRHMYYDGFIGSGYGGMYHGYYPQIPMYPKNYGKYGRKVYHGYGNPFYGYQGYGYHGYRPMYYKPKIYHHGFQHY